MLFSSVFGEREREKVKLLLYGTFCGLSCFRIQSKEKPIYCAKYALLKYWARDVRVEITNDNILSHPTVAMP